MACARPGRQRATLGRCSAGTVQRHCALPRALRLKVLASASSSPPSTWSANPYKVLGVPDGADEKEVKRAYRKLALQHHPDIAKGPGCEAKFISLTEAYELLTGKARGKDLRSHHHDANHQQQEGAWDFHDWYWSFRMSRSWEKQGGSKDTGRSFQAGFQQPEAKANLNSQLAGLRQRAAVRSQKRRQAPAAAEQHAQEQGQAGEQQTQQQHAHSYDAASGVQQPSATQQHSTLGGSARDTGDLRHSSGGAAAVAAGMPFATMSTDNDSEADEVLLDVLLAEGAMMRERASKRDEPTEAAVPAATEADARHHHAAVEHQLEQQQQHHVRAASPRAPAFDGHAATPIHQNHAQNHAVPLPAAFSALLGRRSSSSASLGSSSSSTSSDADAPAGPQGGSGGASAPQHHGLTGAGIRTGATAVLEQLRQAAAPAVAALEEAFNAQPVQGRSSTPQRHVQSPRLEQHHAVEQQPLHHAAPQQQEQEQQLYAVADGPADSDPLAFDAAEGSGASGGAAQAPPRRKFVMTSDGRKDLSHQLAGLRRKAALKHDIMA